MTRGLVHDLTVRRLQSSETDGEGRTARTEVGRHVRGRISPFGSAGVTEAQVAAQHGERIDAVAIVPVDTPIDRGDRLEASSDIPVLAGVYDVVVVMALRSHLRVHLRRFNL